MSTEEPKLTPISELLSDKYSLVTNINSLISKFQRNSSPDAVSSYVSTLQNLVKDLNASPPEVGYNIATKVYNTHLEIYSTSVNSATNSTTGDDFGDSMDTIKRTILEQLGISKLSLKSVVGTVITTYSSSNKTVVLSQAKQIEEMLGSINTATKLS